MSEWTPEMKDDWYEQEPQATHIVTWRPVVRMQVSIPPWVEDPDDHLDGFTEKLDQLLDDELQNAGSLDPIEGGYLAEWEGHRGHTEVQGSTLDVEDA